MKRTTRHGSTIKCDFPGCEQQFISFSMVRVVREQTKLAGWGRVPGWRLVPIGEPIDRRFGDVCPGHLAMVMLRSDSPAQRRAAELAKAREERKAEAAERRKQREERREAARIAKEAAKEARRIASEAKRSAKQQGAAA